MKRSVPNREPVLQLTERRQNASINLLVHLLEKVSPFITSVQTTPILSCAAKEQSIIISTTIYSRQGILIFQGSEFSNPKTLEFDKEGNRRTRIFYCDPSKPYQKGAVENNHELIRRIVPKGHSFNDYTQDDISLMMNHINSYGRKKLNNQSPYETFSFLHGIDILKKLGVEAISANEITLFPGLLKN